MTALILVLAILDRRDFGRNWRTGMVVAGALLVMGVPGAVLKLAYLDVSKVVPGGKLPIDGGLFIVLVAVFATIAVVLKSAWQVVVYHAAAAEWRQLREEPFPLLAGSPRARWGLVGAAAAFGAAAGVASALAFLALGVEESITIRRMQAMFAEAESVTMAVKLPVALLSVSGPAIAEELAFRGVLLGFLLRVAGRTERAAIGWVAAVALVWALLHLNMTDAPLAKIAQIFLLGVFFGEFARRISLEAAVAAHVALNVAAVIAYYGFVAP